MGLVGRVTLILVFLWALRTIQHTSSLLNLYKPQYTTLQQQETTGAAALGEVFQNPARTTDIFEDIILPARKIVQVAEDQSLSTARSASYQDSECAFREYPPNRFYGLDQSTNATSFLINSHYIYGKFPVVLKPVNYFLPTNKGKICVDQSEWWHANDTTGRISATPLMEKLPFGDGTNPSLLSRSRLEKHLSSKDDILLAMMRDLNAQFLATTVFKYDMVCAWPRNDRRQTSRSLLLLLNEKIETVAQATIYWEPDAPLGKGRIPQPEARGNYTDRTVVFIDDTRLFCRDGQVWISFKLFWYDEGMVDDFQMFSRLHFDFDTTEQQIHAFVRASDTQYACCGRNMAVLEPLSSESSLEIKYLSWLDPVTVSSELLTQNDLANTDTAELNPEWKQTTSKSREPEQVNDSTFTARSMKPEQMSKSSNLHGTSGFLLHVPETNEFIGIAHFHRPFLSSQEKQPNVFAPYGHHYTHAFFTITDAPPYRLTRLSTEFVFPSKTRGMEHDADIIQFASGLEVVEHNGLSYAAIGYGINDCEAAVVFVEMKTIESMLVPVHEEQQLPNLMKLAVHR